MIKIKAVVYTLLISTWNLLPFKIFFGKILKGLKLNHHKIYPDLWINGIVNIKFSSHLIKLICNKNDKMTQHLFWVDIDKGWDATSIKVWYLLSQNSNCVLDIGSNIGLYGLVAEKANPKAKVICFEPSREILKILKQNIDLNQSKIIIENFALSNECGEAIFFDSHIPTAAASLEKPIFLKNEDLNSYTVKVFKADDYCYSNSVFPDLISIDVESHEPQVLEGMKQIIEIHKPTILIEVLNLKIGREIESHLKKFNYLFFKINEGKSVIQSQNLIPEIDAEKSYNFICLSSKHQFLIEKILKLK